jgi:hypothetical protein
MIISRPLIFQYRLNGLIRIVVYIAGVLCPVSGLLLISDDWDQLLFCFPFGLGFLQRFTG